MNVAKIILAEGTLPRIPFRSCFIDRVYFIKDFWVLWVFGPDFNFRLI